MKNLNYLNEYRVELFKGIMGDGYNGAFRIPINNKIFCVIASNGLDWEHISVSILNAERNPTWLEMCKIKEMFFEDEEIAIQYHPKKSEYVNIHEYTLHLWKPIKEIMPTPPQFMV